jgi:Cu/Ag efflux protein CusF
MKRSVAILAICLMAVTAAQAQTGGGGGRRGGKGGARPPSTDPAPAQASAPTPAPKPVDKVEIVGVIKAIDVQTDRVTIQYEAVDALNLPAGTLPFVVSKTALLKDATVGEKVRFSLDSQQISDLKPF